MYRRFLAIAALASSVHVFAADTHTHWGYTGHHSPESWGELSEHFKTCSTGKNQSPINITETVKGRLPKLKLDYHPAHVRISHLEHTVQVDFQDESNKLTVGNRTYTLRQFHFHVPSENMIKDRSFPMEAHFVHSDAQGNLAVVGVLYETGKTNNRLAPIWNNIPAKVSEQVSLAQAFNPADLMPRKLDYYRFSGSLTTPPCSEGVTWMVLKNYDSVDEAQVKKFNTLIGHNSRPVQPVNARVVVE